MKRRPTGVMPFQAAGIAGLPTGKSGSAGLFWSGGAFFLTRYPFEENQVISCQWGILLVRSATTKLF